jgi:hypothetical protein
MDSREPFYPQTNSLFFNHWLNLTLPGELLKDVDAWDPFLGA